jgi:hypothetical protein
VWPIQSGQGAAASKLEDSNPDLHKLEGKTMTRKFFYTAIRRDGEEVALLVKGYFDGTFYYYKARYNRWHAVHPLTGLSAASAYTRKQCQALAFDNLEKVEEYMHKRGEKDIAWFNSLRKVIDPDFEI